MNTFRIALKLLHINALILRTALLSRGTLVSTFLNRFIRLTIYRRNKPFETHVLSTPKLRNNGKIVNIYS